MILSHKLKFIFLAVPKTGTHSIRQALRPHLGSEDEEQVGLFVKKRVKNEELAKFRHGHLSALKLKGALGADIWDAYFKFAVVRNPWDKYISFCFFMHRNNQSFKRNPKPFLHRIIDHSKATNRVLFRPQAEFLCDDSGKIIVDFVGKFETLQQSYDLLTEKLGIATQVLEKINNSSHLPYQDYYDEEMKQKVGNFYKRDIDIFDFKF